jgi:transposase
MPSISKIWAESRNNLHAREDLVPTGKGKLTEHRECIRQLPTAGGFLAQDFNHHMQNPRSGDTGRLKREGNEPSAAGSMENPGRNVTAKSGINWSILDQGWSEVRRQLQYKLDWRGGQLIAVPARETSCSCSACGHVSSENRVNQAIFRCLACNK